jgi:hypothetical protein
MRLEKSDRNFIVHEVNKFNIKLNVKSGLIIPMNESASTLESIQNKMFIKRETRDFKVESIIENLNRFNQFQDPIKMSVKEMIDESANYYENEMEEDEMIENDKRDENDNEEVEEVEEEEENKNIKKKKKAK